MRALPRLLIASTLALGFVLAPGCKRTGETSSRHAADRPDKPKRKAGMPKPYKIAAKPDFAAYVAAPDEALAASAAYAQGLLPGGRALLRNALSPSPTDFDSKVAQTVDTQRPWAGAFVEGQHVLWLPVAPAHKATVAGLLASKPPEGSFGAVSLQRSGVGPKLAWLDDETGYIALADDLRGLATARSLPFEIGKHGLYLAITAEHARRFVPVVPFSRVEMTGAGAHDFTLVTEDTDTSDAPGLAELTEGALTGMLQAKQVAIGVSSKYKDHTSWTTNTLADIKREINRNTQGLAGALIRGNLDNLHRRLGSVLRSWDGKLVAGVRPKNHLLLGFGSADPKKMGGATHHLIEGIRENISTARTFGIDIPKVGFDKSRTSSAGTNIAVVAIDNAKKFVPKEYWALINDKGKLRMAMAFSERAGGAMIAIGPDCTPVLEKWLEQIKSAPSAGDSAGDLAAATVAVNPDTMKALSGAGLPAVASKLLQLSAERDPTSVVVRREAARYEFIVKGPKVEARPVAARAASPARVPSGATPSRAATRAGGKPTRSTSGSAKPIREG